jgi:hypothetical protein
MWKSTNDGNQQEQLGRTGWIALEAHIKIIGPAILEAKSSRNLIQQFWRQWEETTENLTGCFTLPKPSHSSW